MHGPFRQARCRARHLTCFMIFLGHWRNSLSWLQWGWTMELTKSLLWGLKTVQPSNYSRHVYVSDGEYKLFYIKSGRRIVQLKEYPSPPQDFDILNLPIEYLLLPAKQWISQFLLSFWLLSLALLIIARRAYVRWITVRCVASYQVVDSSPSPMIVTVPAIMGKFFTTANVANVPVH